MKVTSLRSTTTTSGWASKARASSVRSLAAGLRVELSRHRDERLWSRHDVELCRPVRRGQTGTGLCRCRAICRLVHRIGRLAVVPEARASFPPELASATQARHFAEQVLDRWGMADVRETVRLLVSELVINAVLHAGTEVTLSLRSGTEGLLVEVADGSTSTPVVRVPSATTPTGRGLQILQTLSDDWGVDVASDGKTVWFTLVSASPSVGEAAASRPDRSEVRR